MKKLFGKVLVGAVGLVMALGVNAFAANEISINPPTVNKESGSVTISGTITGEAAEATILVVPEDVSLANVTDDQIRYIDQQTAQNGSFSYEFVLTPGVKYTVYCGGTDINAPDDSVIDLTEGGDTPTPGNYKIIGSVTLSADGADVTKVTATADKTTANANAEGKYELEVANGTYDVVVGRAGYLYKTFSGVEVSNGNVELDAVNLLAGNITEDGAADTINLFDLQSVLDVYRAKAEEANYDAKCDLNDDESINLFDLQALLDNYRSTAADYDAE